MASTQPQMHLAQSNTSSSNEAATSDSGTRVQGEETGYTSNAPLTSSPGEVSPSSGLSSAMRKNQAREGTGNSQNITISEPQPIGRGDSQYDSGHHGLSEKMHGLRHRPGKKGSGPSRQGSSHAAGRPEPQRSMSAGPRGFLQRIATVGDPLLNEVLLS